MSKSKIRTSARFLTDRMAYELDLTPRQYDDFYEINYDFLYEANLVMDDVMRGYRDAIYYYYELLDRRNEDASYVLNYYQYSRFMDADYFYRPIFNAGGRWNLRIYVTYSNHKFYYYDAPRHYKTYRGEHGRRYYSKGYYSGRYKKQDRYTGRMRISGSRDFGRSLKNDFGVNVRDRGRDNRYNNYSNPNQSNRTQDERYRDVSGNRYSPEINNRNNGTRPNGNVTATEATHASRRHRPRQAHVLDVETVAHPAGMTAAHVLRAQAQPAGMTAAPVLRTPAHPAGMTMEPVLRAHATAVAL